MNEIESRIKAIEIRPGDVLVFETPRRLGQQGREHVTTMIRKCESLTGVPVLILDDGMTVSTIRRTRGDGSNL